MTNLLQQIGLRLVNLQHLFLSYWLYVDIPERRCSQRYLTSSKFEAPAPSNDSECLLVAEVDRQGVYLHGSELARTRASASRRKQWIVNYIPYFTGKALPSAEGFCHGDIWSIWFDWLAKYPKTHISATTEAYHLWLCKYRCVWLSRYGGGLTVRLCYFNYARIYNINKTNTRWQYWQNKFRSSSLSTRARAVALLIAEHAPNLLPSLPICRETDEFGEHVNAEFKKVKEADKETGKRWRGAIASRAYRLQAYIWQMREYDWQICIYTINYPSLSQVFSF